ncbi:MBL fold metallo-hydrolase [Streptomyces sp. NBC_00503]|uniref:MBL fold metallo-hydrolase n=1 Tax=Streptomyces sp. NBC_00503 TaxID=2903659 RepID=UPI002E8056B0|nr:MBL fold metallo-hydrolase [Streptomyces sp. NBC_00503]WUD86581.1 MBL fold metallo-hydrolase [Streptomyces sp. NBC_00503]
MSVQVEATTTEIADGVYAYVQPHGGWCLNNAGLVVGANGQALLVDTVATERRARLLREEVLKRAAPPRALVNTHFHGDHTFGNYLFPEAVLFAHEEARTMMSATGLGLTGLWPDVCWGELEVALPDVTYRDALTLRIGGVRAELLHLGPAAHTTGDTAVWLPEQRVLFAGDLLMSGAAPFCLMGSVSGSLAAMERLRDLGAETVVPGHGPVGGPDLIESNAAYFRWLAEQARLGVAAGLTPLQLARELGDGPFCALLDAERLVPNLHRAYAELAGAAPGDPLDVGALFQEMAEFNGGVPACHA